MSLTQIRDQEAALQSLRGFLRHGRIPAGLLFWGPDGVGKRLAAMEFAKAVNCKEASGDACDACISCRKAEQGMHPDIRVIVPARKQRIIPVAVVEEIIDMVMFRPHESPYRVFIFEDADRINVQAQNKLLKTLEEPPTPAVFIFLTSQPRQILPTIRSRCQSVRFGLLSPATVADIIQHHTELDRLTAETLSALAYGQAGPALEMARSDRRTVVLELLDRLESGEDPLVVTEELGNYLRKREEEIGREIQDAFARDTSALDAEDRSDAPRDDREVLEAEIAGKLHREVREILRLIAFWQRDRLIAGLGLPPEKLLNRDRAENLADKVRCSPEQYARRLEAIEKAGRYLERNIGRDRILRDLFFELIN
ncbi:MAG TPA: DNA polymerase III subunit delta' [Candidatus Hydrogenedentes bacterium]|nr:DNA polymerase III subunit delta' [Candidatus Hydrogenedentota bacterium]